MPTWDELLWPPDGTWPTFDEAGTIIEVDHDAAYSDTLGRVVIGPAPGNLDALYDLVATLRNPDGAMVELAKSLAAAIDAQPEQGLAALAKEYRATLKALTDVVSAVDPFAAVLAEMGDATQPG